jgi:EpsI family protein
VLIAAAAAVLANFLRVFIVVYLGYATDMQHPYVHDHLMLGWYLFGGLVAILLFADARLYRHYQRVNNTDESGKKTAAYVNPSPVVCTKGNIQYLAIVFSSALILSAGPAAIYTVNHQSQAENVMVELELPAGTGGWTGPLASSDDWAPVFHGAISQKKVYQKANEQVILYLGFYPAQKQGEELISDLNRINNKEIWKTHYPRARLKQANDQQVLEQLMKKRNGEQRLVWYWYRVAGRNTTNKYEAKILQALNRLM